MRRELGLLTGILALAWAVAGCGLSAELLAPDDAREPLKKGFYTTYTFQYRVHRSGPLKIFKSRTILEPRLLRADSRADFDAEPGAFRDTGAPFDPKTKTITWKIPNVRELYGKTLHFTVDGKNLDRHPLLAVSFPARGRLLAAEGARYENRVRFTLDHAGEIFNLRFLARLGGDRKLPIQVAEIEGSPMGTRVFEWDPTKDLDPKDSRYPISFAVEYEDWYYVKASQPYITSAVRVPRSVVFGEPFHTAEGMVRVPFRTWGKQGLVTFEYAGTSEWRVAKHVHVEEKADDGPVLFWDLAKEGLTPLSRTVKLRARSLGADLGQCEVLPPKPAIRVQSVRQEGDTVFILFDSSFIAPDEVRIFAGSGKNQRLVRPDEIVKRTQGLVAFRIGRLAVERTPERESFLFVFLSAQNASGSAGREVKVPLVSLEILSVRQVRDEIEVRLDSGAGVKPPELAYRKAGTGEWMTASRVKHEPGRIRWAYLEEFGGNNPGEIELRLTSSRGDSTGEARSRIEPLQVLAGLPVARGNGVFEIPMEVKGPYDWVRFEFDPGGTGFREARAARFDSDLKRVRWVIWEDLPKDAYEGEEAVLRATFRNAWGFAVADVSGIRPSFLRLGTPKIHDGVVQIPIRFREGMGLSFFFSTDLGQSFGPLKGARIEGGELRFETASLGILTGKTVKIRVAARGAGTTREEDDVTVRLHAGIDKQRAYWHLGQLWIRYEVDWHVSEKDVRAEFYAEGPDARAPVWEEASVPEWKVFDVNRRGFAWDVARDMARAGTQDPARLHLRLVIRAKGGDKIVRQITLADLPSPPVKPLKPVMGLREGILTFSLGGVQLPPDAPPFSLDDYNFHLEFIDPATTHFRRALLHRPFCSGDTLAWKRAQSFKPVRRGTWVKLVVNLKGNSRVTGFALLDVHLDSDHPFFTGDEEGF